MSRLGKAWRVLNRTDVLATLMAVLGVLSCMQIVGLTFLFSRVSGQANAGARARQTQCDREPVIEKVANAAYAVRRYLPPPERITLQELKRFAAHAPRCP